MAFMKSPGTLAPMFPPCPFGTRKSKRAAEARGEATASETIGCVASQIQRRDENESLFVV